MSLLIVGHGSLAILRKNIRFPLVIYIGLSWDGVGPSLISDSMISNESKASAITPRSDE